MQSLKSMFAVLHCGKACWEDMSETYRNSPYINLDTDVLTLQDAEIRNAHDACDKDEPMQDPEPHVAEEDQQEQSEADLEKSRTKFRDFLKECVDLSFECRNKDVMDTLSNTMATVLGILRDAVPSENGIPLHKEGQKTGMKFTN